MNIKIFRYFTVMNVISCLVIKSRNMISNVFENFFKLTLSEYKENVRLNSEYVYQFISFVFYFKRILLMYCCFNYKKKNGFANPHLYLDQPKILIQFNCQVVSEEPEAVKRLKMKSSSIYNIKKN